SPRTAPAGLYKGIGFDHRRRATHDTSGSIRPRSPPVGRRGAVPGRLAGLPERGTTGTLNRQPPLITGTVARSQGENATVRGVFAGVPKKIASIDGPNGPVRGSSCLQTGVHNLLLTIRLPLTAS